MKAIRVSNDLLNVLTLQTYQELLIWTLEDYERGVIVSYILGQRAATFRKHFSVEFKLFDLARQILHIS